MSEPSNAGNKKDVPEQIDTDASQIEPATVEVIDVKKDVPEKIDIDAVELKTIEVRLNGVKDATHRSRFIFIIMTIVTAAILITLWNSILSWDRGMAFEQRSDNPVIAENQRTVTSEWIKNLVISVGLLGIRVGTSDLAVLGSSSLIVIMVWFFFSQRRENRAIVGLLRYCRDGLDEEKLGKEVCSLVYEGIVQSIVFIDMGGGDRPIRGLISEETDAQPNLFIRAILKGLVFLPPFAILMIVISDISSLLLPSYLRDSKEELWRTLFNGKHNIEVAKIFIFDVFGLIACIYTWFLCRKCREFSEATSETIKEFKVSVLS